MWKLVTRRNKCVLYRTVLIVLIVIMLLYFIRIIKKTEYLDFMPCIDSIASISFKYQGEDQTLLKLDEKDQIKDFLQYLGNLKLVKENRIIYCEIRKPLFCFINDNSNRTLYMLRFEREYVYIFRGYNEMSIGSYSLKYHIPFCKHPVEYYVMQMDTKASQGK